MFTIEQRRFDRSTHAHVDPEEQVCPARRRLSSGTGRPRCVVIPGIEMIWTNTPDEYASLGRRGVGEIEVTKQSYLNRGCDDSD